MYSATDTARGSTCCLRRLQFFDRPQIQVQKEYDIEKRFEYLLTKYNRDSIEPPLGVFSYKKSQFASYEREQSFGRIILMTIS